MIVAASAIIIPNAMAAPSSIAGMVVFIDPGHNGGNASLMASIDG